MNCTDYPPLAPDACPEFAVDLLMVSQFPDFEAGPILHVSRADIDRARRLNINRIPLRTPAGRRLSAQWNDYKTIRAADRFAEKNGWPFMLHLSYLSLENFKITIS